MAFLDLQGARFNYRLEGPESAPVLVLSNSLACALSMWEAQVGPFTKQFRVLRYDQRGHGQTAVTPGPYTTAQLGQDVIGLMDGLKIKQAHFLGLSMGGAAGQWLALNEPARFNKIVLSNTASKFGTPDVWAQRIETARTKGMAALVDATMERWFTAGFRAKSPKAVQDIRKVYLATNPAGFIACSEAIRDTDFQEAIRAIKKPVLVIAGTHDMGTPAAAGKLISERIPGAKYVELDAAHLSNIEAPEVYTKTVLDFLAG
jgi:3-oxoadipate enol-lactonase